MSSPGEQDPPPELTDGRRDDWQPHALAGHGTILCRFSLPFQLSEFRRSSHPASALFRLAPREEVDSWLLKKGRSFRTDRDLVLRYSLELRDLRHEDEPPMCLKSIVADERAAAMIAAVFLSTLRFSCET